MRSFISLRPASRFGSLYRSGTRRRFGAITVYHAVGQSTTPEVGVVAGKRVGNAVKRNRAKRRLRAAIHAADLRQNTAYVVVASSGVLDAPFVELTNWLNRAVVGNDGITDKDEE
ncbi:MAG: ribonuclease P protein component [Actinomycetia bacterium]|nr:ribonuclease P protein component [Actinomycetes bacterium]